VFASYKHKSHPPKGDQVRMVQMVQSGVCHLQARCMGSIRELDEEGRE